MPPIDKADVARWHGRDPPDIVFTIEDLVPQGMVTLLTSQGGAGKTLLLQMAGTVVAAGAMRFLGKAAVTGKAAGVFAEDPESVLHVRQPRINEFLESDYDRIAGRYFPQSYFGQPAQLWRDGQGNRISRRAGKRVEANRSAAAAYARQCGRAVLRR